MVTNIMNWCLNIALPLAVSSFVALAVTASAQVKTSTPTIETITSRMAQANADNRARSRPYLVTREYKMFGKDREETKSDVTVNISFAPPNSKTYVIQHAVGSDLGEIIVRRMLEGEVAIEKDSSSIDISESNYEFHFVREEDLAGQRCYVLEFVPKRKDKNLLRANIWVDANTYLPHRVEGNFERNPSWWVKNVNIVLLFGDAGGMWLQTALEATGNVRILGQATVVSQNLNYEIGEAVADKSSAQHDAVFSGPISAMDVHK